MARQASILPLMICSVVLSLSILIVAFPTGVQSIGVCYGRLGDNLPQPSEVVSLYKSHNFSSMRLYGPDPDTLQALRGSDIRLVLGVPNTDVQSLASNSSAASAWVQDNVLAYWPAVSFRHIAVGNELIPDVGGGGGGLASSVLPAMRNVQNALRAAGLQLQVKVSTAVSTAVLGTSYPPSAGEFSSSALLHLSPIFQFLADNGAPLLVNVYTYFSYAGNAGQVSLSYALFTSPDIIVQDGQFGYRNLFDAIVDAVYSALERAGGADVAIVVSESGWPSAGGAGATAGNARTYNQNLIEHVDQGTPKRPGRALEAYIYEVFNEDQKNGKVEQNFGLFYPDKRPVYNITVQEDESVTTEALPRGTICDGNICLRLSINI